MEEIRLKISIDGKEATGVLALTEDNLSDIYRTLGKIKTEGKSASDHLASGFNGARMVLQGMQETYSVLLGLFAKPVQAAAQVETFQTQFKVLLKSADEAQNRIAELTDFAATTPFQLPEVVKASIQLETLTKGALATGEGLRMVGDVAAGTGQRIDELSTWFGRLYDGIQSNRPVGEALQRLQELGAVSGDVRAQLEKLHKENRLSAEGWALVTKEMEKFSGMMEERSKTLEGQLSNLEDNFGKVQAAIGGMIAIALSPLLESISKMIDFMFQLSPTLTGIIGLIGSLTVFYTTLRISGIIPATFSLKAFAAGLITVKSALLSTGLLAAIVALGYGFSKLSEAADNANERVAGKEQAESRWNKTIMKGKYGDSKPEEIQKAIQEYEGLLSFAQTSGQKLAKDFDWQNQLIDNEEWIKRLRHRIDALKAMLPVELKTLELTEEEKEKLFKKELENSTIKQLHETKMLNIRQGNFAEEYALTKQHIAEQIAIYTKYGQDIRELRNRDIENEALYLQNIQTMREELKAAELGKYKVTFDEQKVPDDELLPDVAFMSEANLNRLKIESIDNEFERKKALAQWELSNSLEQYKNYENYAQIKEQLEINLAANLEEINKNKADRERQEMNQTFSVFANLFGRMTVAGKLASFAQASMNVWEGATKALAQGGVLGLLTMGSVIATGFEAIRNIVDTKIPKLAKGGVVDRPTLALIGEAGPEGVFPLHSNRAQSLIGSSRTDYLMEKLIQEMQQLPLRFDLRVSQGELRLANEYTDWSFRKRKRI